MTAAKRSALHTCADSGHLWTPHGIEIALPRRCLNDFHQNTVLWIAPSRKQFSVPPAINLTKFDSRHPQEDKLQSSARGTPEDQRVSASKPMFYMNYKISDPLKWSDFNEISHNRPAKWPARVLHFIFGLSAQKNLSHRSDFITPTFFSRIPCVEIYFSKRTLKIFT